MASRWASSGFRGSAAFGQCIDSSLDAIDATAQRIELAVGLKTLAGGQIVAKQANLVILVALFDSVIGNNAAADLLQERRNGFGPNAPPSARQRNPAWRCLPV